MKAEFNELFPRNFLNPIKSKFWFIAFSDSSRIFIGFLVSWLYSSWMPCRNSLDWLTAYPNNSQIVKRDPYLDIESEGREWKHPCLCTQGEGSWYICPHIVAEQCNPPNTSKHCCSRYEKPLLYVRKGCQVSFFYASSMTIHSNARIESFELLANAHSETTVGTF